MSDRSGTKMHRHNNHRDIVFTRWLFRAYLALLFLLPVPLGSNRPLFWSLFVMAAAAIALAWSIGWLGGVAHFPRSGMRRARWALTALGLFCALGAVCLMGFEFVPTLDWQASADALLLSCGLLLLAVLTVLLVRSKRRALVVLFTLVLAGLLQAVYGSLMILSGVEMGFLEPKEFGRGVATGTFINRNHFANLLMLSLSAGIGLMLAQMDLRGAEGMRNKLRSLLQAALGPKARLRVYLVVMVIALVLTRSRMGNMAFFASISLVGLFALWRLRKPSRPLLILVISVLVIDVFVVGTWFGMEKVIDRMQRTVQVQEDQWVVRDQNRITANIESLEIISRNPIVGYGGGTFYTVYPAWRGADQKFLDHAHNDYLEFLVEYGLIGGALLAGFLAVCMTRASGWLKHRSRPRQFGICFASLMAMFGILIHAAVDFSLHIPANAAWFLVLCLLPLATSSSGHPSAA
jgi:O-antigen ligase